MRLDQDKLFARELILNMNRISVANGNIRIYRKIINNLYKEIYEMVFNGKMIDIGHHRLTFEERSIDTKLFTLQLFNQIANRTLQIETNEERKININITVDKIVELQTNLEQEKQKEKDKTESPKILKKNN